MQRYVTILAFSACFFAATIAEGQSGAPPEKKADPAASDKKDAGKKEPAKKAEMLEQLIAEALKNNPDIRVAEAKLRVAEAEAERARIKLIAELTTLHADIEGAQASAEEAKKKYQRLELLYSRSAVAREDVDAALSSYVKRKAELASLQAKLPYLLGRQNGKASAYIRRDPTLIGSEAFLQRILLSEALSHSISAAKAPETPLTEKLRKALDATTRLKIDGVAPKDAFEYLRDTALPGINVIVRAKLKKDSVTIKLSEPVPVGAALQYLEDELEVVFILRDYGIVVVSADERLPPGAIRVVDFWKQGAAGKTDDPLKAKPGVLPTYSK